MRLKASKCDLEAGKPTIVLHPIDAEKIGVHSGDKALVASQSRRIYCRVQTYSEVPEGSVYLSKEALRVFHKLPESVDVMPAEPSSGLAYIKAKAMGKKLKSGEIYTIIKEIVERKLGDPEITMFLTSLMVHGMDLSEIKYLTRAMAETGEIVEWPFGPIHDIHSIGGVPGNKTALLAVPIVASFGLKIPKTSSRAITSPAGTADVVEVLANVSFTAEEIVEIVSKTNGCMVWGGALNLAPADDITIEVERVLSIDPEPMLLASIMSKKVAMGVDRLIIDMPTGTEAKIENQSEAESLASQFIELGKRLGISTKVAITYGGQPIGRNVGPALEALEALETLMKGEGPGSLIHKATSLAGIVLEEAGVAPRGHGKEYAMKALKEGKAYEKFKEIIEAQGGNPDVKPEDIKVGEYTETFTAPMTGYVTYISNRAITAIARAAGAPREKGAGVKLYVKNGEKVREGDPIFEIFSESEERLSEAIIVARQRWPIRIEGMLLRIIQRFLGIQIISFIFMSKNLNV